MRSMFIRLLVVNAVLQFAMTRARAGRAQDEGDAEGMWLRYPIAVVVNAVIWTLMISTVSRIVRPLVPKRS